MDICSIFFRPSCALSSDRSFKFDPINIYTVSEIRERENNLSNMRTTTGSLQLNLFDSVEIIFEKDRSNLLRSINQT